MVGSAAAFSLMNICVRLLSAQMHTTVIVFWRNLFALLLMLPWVLRSKGMLRTNRIGGHLWRAIIGNFGMQSWFYCLATLPLTQATALSFTAPLFTTLFAVLILRERADKYRWLALLGGFIGVLIVVRPGLLSFNLASLLVLGTASLWAVVGMQLKSLSRTEPSLRIVFYMAGFMVLFSLPVALPHWIWPTTPQCLLLLAAAAASTAAQLLLVKAYSLTDIVKLVPFDFTRLIFTAMLSYIIFGENSSPATWLGAGIIIASAVLIAKRDAKTAFKQADS
jgi:drug/metabolite transporter (DMT)-like permease